MLEYPKLLGPLFIPGFLKLFALILVIVIVIPDINLSISGAEAPPLCSPPLAETRKIFCGLNNNAYLLKIYIQLDFNCKKSVNQSRDKGSRVERQREYS